MSKRSKLSSFTWKRQGLSITLKSVAMKENIPMEETRHREKLKSSDKWYSGAYNPINGCKTVIMPSHYTRINPGLQLFGNRLRAISKRRMLPVIDRATIDVALIPTKLSLLKLVVRLCAEQVIKTGKTRIGLESEIMRNINESTSLIEVNDALHALDASFLLENGEFKTTIELLFNTLNNL